jgi:hypothetical protein
VALRGNEEARFRLQVRPARGLEYDVFAWGAPPGKSRPSLTHGVRASQPRNFQAPRRVCVPDKLTHPIRELDACSLRIHHNCWRLVVVTDQAIWKRLSPNLKQLRPFLFSRSLPPRLLDGFGRAV